MFNLEKKIPEMLGAIAISMDASKNQIYPKVTTLKRVTSNLLCIWYFLNSAAATKVIPPVAVDIIHYQNTCTALRGPTDWTVVPAL